MFYILWFSAGRGISKRILILKVGSGCRRLGVEPFSLGAQSAPSMRARLSPQLFKEQASERRNRWIHMQAHAAVLVNISGPFQVGSNHLPCFLSPRTCVIPGPPQRAQIIFPDSVTGMKRAVHQQPQRLMHKESLFPVSSCCDLGWEWGQRDCAVEMLWTLTHH